MSYVTKLPLGETSSLVVYEGDAILLTWLRHPGADLAGARAAIEAARAELDDIERLITNENYTVRAAGAGCAVHTTAPNRKAKRWT